MGGAGLFDDDARVELVDGEVTRMAPVGSLHAACVSRTDRALQAAVGDRAVVWAQNPVVLGDRSEPQPDLALLRSRPDDYAAGLPGPDGYREIRIAGRGETVDIEAFGLVLAAADLLGPSH